MANYLMHDHMWALCGKAGGGFAQILATVLTKFGRLIPYLTSHTYDLKLITIDLIYWLKWS